MADLHEVVNDPDQLAKLQEIGIKDSDHLAKQFLADKAYIQSTPRLPSENASAEEMAQFWQRLGAPKEPNGYQVPDTLAENHRHAFEMVRDDLHKVGLTSKQFEAVSKSIDRALGERRQAEVDMESQANKQAIDQWFQENKERYGGSVEEIEARAHRAAQQLFGDDDELLSQLKTKPQFLEMMMKADPLLNDDTIPTPGGDQTSQVNFRLEEAQQMALEARTLLKQGMNSKTDPDHQQRVTRWYQIQKKLQENGYQGIDDPKLQLNQMLGIPDPGTMDLAEMRAAFGKAAQQNPQEAARAFLGRSVSE